ncbi:MAG: DUF4058 family protein [Pirellulaceae bacterium]
MQTNYRISTKQALPVPLRRPDSDIIIDLAEVFTTAYDRGRFARRIDYFSDVPSHLNANEKQWAEATLQQYT